MSKVDIDRLRGLRSPETATPTRWIGVVQGMFLVGRRGIEPPTQGFSRRVSGSAISGSETASRIAYGRCHQYGLYPWKPSASSSAPSARVFPAGSRFLSATSPDAEASKSAQRAGSRPAVSKHQKMGRQGVSLAQTSLRHAIIRASPASEAKDNQADYFLDFRSSNEIESHRLRASYGGN